MSRAGSWVSWAWALDDTGDARAPAAADAGMAAAGSDAEVVASSSQTRSSDSQISSSGSQTRPSDSWMLLDSQIHTSCSQMLLDSQIPSSCSDVRTQIPRLTSGSIALQHCSMANPGDGLPGSIALPERCSIANPRDGLLGSIALPHCSIAPSSPGHDASPIVRTVVGGCGSTPARASTPPTFSSPLMRSACSLELGPGPPSPFSGADVTPRRACPAPRRTPFCRDSPPRAGSPQRRVSGWGPRLRAASARCAVHTTLGGLPRLGTGGPLVWPRRPRVVPLLALEVLEALLAPRALGGVWGCAQQCLR